MSYSNYENGNSSAVSTRMIGQAMDLPPKPQLSAVLDGASVCANNINAIDVVAGVADPIDYAKYLIFLAYSEDEPDYLTHLRLQKLMYYVQAWSLALRDRPAFTGRIEAWAHGPVVKELYPCFTKYKDQPIPPQDFKGPITLSNQDRDFIASVWNAYKGYTSYALRSMTHQETPWRIARGAAGPADACNTEITHSSMKEYFSQRI